jgi:hypothetical protein
VVAGPIDQLSVKQVSAIGENTLKKVSEWITWPQRARPQNLVWWVVDEHHHRDRRAGLARLVGDAPRYAVV